MKTRRAYKAGAAAPQIGLELELSSWSERLHGSELGLTAINWLQVS
jgi:hypothetical protein